MKNLSAWLSACLDLLIVSAISFCLLVLYSPWWGVGDPRKGRQRRPSSLFGIIPIKRRRPSTFPVKTLLKSFSELQPSFIQRIQGVKVKGGGGGSVKEN